MNFPLTDEWTRSPSDLSNVAIPNQGAHNVLYVVTEHDSAYAFDAATGALLWNTSLLGSGETPSDPRGCDQVTPEIGITSTPVIDRGRGAIYIIAMSKDGSGNYYPALTCSRHHDRRRIVQRPRDDCKQQICGTGDNSNGQCLISDPRAIQGTRRAVDVKRRRLYTAWASHCNMSPSLHGSSAMTHPPWRKPACSIPRRTETRRDLDEQRGAGRG